MQRCFRSGVEFRLLGPVEAIRDGEALALGGPKQRALLALLLLARGKPVSRDRLIDGLWGGSPPRAATSLDSYVSRLRRLVGPERLERHPAGYVLLVDEDELDLARFERLVARAHATPDVRERAQVLRDALALWRGPALADLQFEPVAAEAVARMEEQRLEALEQRLDAELEAGARSELVPELEQLVREHPLRERFVGQLMLALYRAGRQADALSTYQVARRRLAEELGLEPSPALRDLERRVLAHDPELTPRRRDARPRSLRKLVAGTAVVVAVAASAAIALHFTTSTHDALANGATVSRLLALDPGSSGARAVAILPGPPAALASGFGSLWATDPNDEQLLRIDTRSGAVVDRIRIAAQPSSLATGGGAVWVASAVGGLVTRIDPASDRVTDTIRLGGANPAALVFAGGALWVADTTDRSLVRIDPETGAVKQSITLPLAPTALAAGDGELWAAGADAAQVDQVDLASAQIVDELPVGQGPAAVTLAHGSVWVANSLDGTLTQIDADTGRTRATTPIGSGPTAIATSGKTVFVANQYTGTVVRIAARSGRVTGTSRVAGEPTTVAFAGKRLWVGAGASPAVHRGGVLVLSSTTHIPTVDPAFEFTAEPTGLPRLAYDTLVTFDNEPGARGLRLVPDLALQLPPPTSGGTVYAFRLRPGLRYSDGRRVRASDFRRAFERIFRSGSPGESFFTAIAGAGACMKAPHTCTLAQGVVTDDRTGRVIFHLSRPDPDFLYELTEFAYTAPIPPGTPSRNLRFHALPGTGPYRIVRASRNEIRLERNPYFHEWSHAAQPDGNPDSIVWRFPPSHAAEARQIVRGRADWTWDYVPPTQLREIERAHPSLLHVNPGFIVEFIPLNTNKTPFDSLQVRRALNYAIDRREIVRLYGGSLFGKPLCQPLPPGIPGYLRYCPYTVEPSESGAYTGPDLGHARRLVAQSGRAGAHVTVWGVTDAAAIPHTVPLYVARVLRELGFKTTVRLVPSDSITFAQRRSFQLSVDGDWLLDFPSAASFLPSFFGCRGAHNHSYYCNPSLDRLMAAATALDVARPERAARLWSQAERVITDEAYWVPTMNLNEVDLVSPRLQNYEFNPVWGFLADQAWVR